MNIRKYFKLPLLTVALGCTTIALATHALASRDIAKPSHTQAVITFSGNPQQITTKTGLLLTHSNAKPPTSNILNVPIRQTYRF